MLTNLLATIVTCLVTNTTEKFPQHEVPDPSPTYGNITLAVYRCHLENDLNPTCKTVITEVVQVTTISFDWDGVNLSTKKEKVMSHSETEYVLDQLWKPKSK